jgi:hypothetical protein
VLILNNFKFNEIRTYEKPGGRGPIVVNQVTVNQTFDYLRPAAGIIHGTGCGVSWAIGNMAGTDKTQRRVLGAALCIIEALGI